MLSNERVWGSANWLFRGAARWQSKRGLVQRRLSVEATVEYDDGGPIMHLVLVRLIISDRCMTVERKKGSFALRGCRILVPCSEAAMPKARHRELVVPVGILMFGRAATTLSAQNLPNDGGVGKACDAAATGHRMDFRFQLNLDPPTSGRNGSTGEHKTCSSCRPASDRI